MMTETEAKTKWCPFARVMTTIDARDAGPIAIASINRGLGEKPVGACIASACMAWRWNLSGPTEGAVYEYGDQKFPGKPTTGFCGLVGRSPN